jgi:hypothetical protein
MEVFVNSAVAWGGTEECGEAGEEANLEEKDIPLETEEDLAEEKDGEVGHPGDEKKEAMVGTKRDES